MPSLSSNDQWLGGPVIQRPVIGWSCHPTTSDWVVLSSNDQWSGGLPLTWNWKMTFLVEHVYWSRYDKPPLAARCCHVANELTDFTGDRQINEQTEGHCHCIKPPRLWVRKWRTYEGGEKVHYRWRQPVGVGTVYWKDVYRKTSWDWSDHVTVSCR